MSAWLLTLAFMTTAAWSLTEALALTHPHLTARQRWWVAFWLFSAAGGISLAWKAGA